MGWCELEQRFSRALGAACPHVYRRLPDVLKAQGPTVEVPNTPRPLTVVMAGMDEFDPDKDYRAAFWLLGFN